MTKEEVLDKIQNGREMAWRVYENLTDELKNDYDIAVAAIKKTNFILRDMPDNFRNNPEMLKIALDGDVSISNPIQYALSGALTKENIDLAMTKGRLMVHELTPALLSNRNFILKYAATNATSDLLKKLPDEFKEDVEIAKAMANCKSYVFHYLSEELRSNPDVLYAALSSKELITSNPIQYALSGALTEENIDLAITKSKIRVHDLTPILLSNKYLVLKMMEKDVDVFKKASEEIRNDIGVINAALLLNPKMLFNIGSNSLTNEMIDFAINNGLEINENNIPNIILSSELFVKRFLPIYPSIYKNLPSNLKSNIELALIALSKDVENFKYVPSEIVDDDIIAAILFNGYKIESEKANLISTYIKKLLLSNPKNIFSLYLNNEIESNNLIYTQVLFQSKISLPLDVKQKYDLIIENLIERYKSKGYDEAYIKSLISKALIGERDILKIDSISSFKQMLYVLNFDDLDETSTKHFVEGLSYDCLIKCNIRHYKDIVESLKVLGNTEIDSKKLAFSIYQSIGYSRARDLLNPDLRKNYGSINIDKLTHLFGNIDLSGVMFAEDGNKYSPVLNEQLINLIYGANYKISNTPIRNYLNNFEDMKQFIESETIRINSNADLSPEDKQQKISSLNSNYDSYRNEIRDFISHIGRIFNEWDIVEEEFIRKSNLSKLEIKLNTAQINEIINNLSQIRKRTQAKAEFSSKQQTRYNRIPNYESRDYPLIKSDLFDYVGIQTQYTTNPELAPKRAVTLSRMMESQKTKKFPNINLNFDNYSIKVFNPQDRDLLSGGYRSGCCFRPNGNADNRGNNNSLLTYCCATEYGGGIEIRDANNKTLMFSPVLRNGNVLMIHSIETIGMSDHEKKVVNAILKEWAKQVIERSEQDELADGIIAVTITDLQPELDKTQCIGALPENKKFNYYDPNNQFSGMYNNLSANHYVIAIEDGKRISDIKYNYPVTKSYEYPIETSDVKSVNVSTSELNIIKEILDAKFEITTMANKRFEMAKAGQELESFEILRQIQLIKQQNLVRYKELSSLSKDAKKDVLSEYVEAVEIANQVCDELGKTRQAITKKFTQIFYSQGWYLGITEDNKLYGNCVKGAEYQYINMMAELKKHYSLEMELEIDNNIISDNNFGGQRR